jgi:hypothetical protein
MSDPHVVMGIRGLSCFLEVPVDPGLVEFVHVWELLKHKRQKANDAIEGFFLLSKICLASLSQVGPCGVGSIVSLVVTLSKVGLPQGCSGLSSGVSLDLDGVHFDSLSCTKGRCIFGAVAHGMVRVAEPRVNSRAVNYDRSGYRDSLFVPREPKEGQL